MQVDILIDKLTDCLVDRSTGKIVETYYTERINLIKKRDSIGWKFDWSVPQKNGYAVYELFVIGDKTVQGRIALKIEGGVANIDIVETAPHNYGHGGKYEGVGGHLFAIACEISMENDCDGVVAFDVKSDLVEYYKKELNAVELYPRRMVIFQDMAKWLIGKYIKRRVV